MRRIAIVLSCCLLVSAGIAAAEDAGIAATEDMINAMFPADVNDSWVLERFAEPATDVRVTEILARTGWMRFEGLFDMNLLLWPHGAEVFVWGDGREPRQLLYDFGAPQGTEWHVAFGGLVGSVTVAEKDAAVTTAFGPMKSCTAFNFLWENLADTGIETQWFCPGVGLVKQYKTTIAGPYAEYTVAASIRGHIATGYLGQGVNVRIDQGDASSGSMLKARIEMWDTTGTQREFRSETSQLFDLRLVNERGLTVRVWSWDQVFLPVVTTWTLDGEKDFEAELLLAHRGGRPLEPGVYTVEGWIIDCRARPGAKTQILVR
jgi:hypothetical protein